ncbi:DUF1772 domain-containing protein [Catelliglobosispora koreensis]|uniref:DUF1772 domain-containing protein n=1 Tax=Catelliglobosispora koreensis TaxID=129052 RepID=UPI00036204A6|nr:DUF1772 domain-containing protein [Catelliglobosispora koreensis]
MTVFMGGLLAMLAAGLHVRAGLRRALSWVIAGPVLCVVMLAVTAGVNVPLNDQLASAEDPGRTADLAAVREAIEPRWPFGCGSTASRQRWRP